ncbi:MAG: YebC/PmpR family DNA-binding transcriptional regulator [Anaerolineales bacterium]
MSGHSKWSTIKRKKAANDAKRGQIFTRLAREIAVAAREGGGDPEVNFSLRLAIDRAKEENMPKDNIERAIKRGTGEDKSADELEQITYEGYGPHGVALMIEVITDNRNRTVADLRHILNDHGGSMGEAGSVAWQFHRAAYFAFSLADHDPDRIFEVAAEAGADDVTFDGDVEIIGPVEQFKVINDELKAVGIKPDEARLEWIADSPLPLSQEETLKAMRVIDKIEDMDDVRAVYSNLEVSEEAIRMLETA